LLKISWLLILIFGISILGFIFFRNQSWFSKFNADALVNKYSQEEIDHFATFAFFEGCIIKWGTNIKISIIPSKGPDSLLYSKVTTCIQELNNLMEEVTIKVVNDNLSNAQFYFVDTLHSKYGSTLIGAILWVIPYPTLSTGEIKIQQRNRSVEEISSTIQHEFTHLLGFHHQSVGYDSSFNPKQSILIGEPPNIKWVPIFENYTDLDKAAIRIMYDADVAIDPGVTKEKFYRKIEEAKRKMKK